MSDVYTDVSQTTIPSNLSNLPPASPEDLKSEKEAQAIYHLLGKYDGLMNKKVSKKYGQQTAYLEGYIEAIQELRKLEQRLIDCPF